MRCILAVLVLSLAVAASAEELTVPEVIAAHRAGAPVEGILRLVREAPAVAVLVASDLEKLRVAGVPGAVIEAMVARHSPTSMPTAAPTPKPAVAPTRLPTATPTVALVFEPLVQMTGVFRKAQVGRLVLTAENLEWSDARDPAGVGRISTSSLKAVWLATTQRNQGSPLIELRIRSAGGDDLTFRDVDGSDGTTSQVEALYRAIRERFPQVVLPEKPAR